MSFDVAKAKCYVEKDRQHLLAVIEMGFGTLDAFSAKLLSLMHSRRSAKGLRHSLASFIQVLRASNAFRASNTKEASKKGAPKPLKKQKTVDVEVFGIDDYSP